jgi:hypothetical protein
MNFDYAHEPTTYRDARPSLARNDDPCHSAGGLGEVMKEIKALGAGLGELSARLEQLEDCLHPVIASPTTPILCAKDPEQEPQSPLGGELAAMNRDLRMKLRQIEQITASIRL